MWSVELPVCGHGVASVVCCMYVLVACIAVQCFTLREWWLLQLLHGMGWDGMGWVV